MALVPEFDIPMDEVSTKLYSLAIHLSFLIVWRSQGMDLLANDRFKLLHKKLAEIEDELKRNNRR